MRSTNLRFVGVLGGGSRLRRALLLALLLVAAALAGCASAPADDPVQPAANESDVMIDENRPDPTFGGQVAVGPAVGPDLKATLERAPQLVEGEWWRIRLESPLDGTSSEFVRVVAKVEPDAYLFGMPHEGWWKEAVIYHTPAFGEVNREDLSYNTHDIHFQPLKFPLVDGDTWETEFSGGPKMTARVKVDSPTRATVTFTSPACGPLGLMAAAGQCSGENTILELVYDATMHEVVEFRHPTVTFTVVEHGYDYEGWVTVPRGERLVFFHGRIGGALDLNAEPAPPVESVEVSGGYNRISFILATIGLAPGPSGACRETATDPAGNTYSTESIPCQGLNIDFFEARDPDGTWQLEHVAAGGSYVFIEGIAYHQYDIRLPDGAIRADHSHEVIR